MLILPILLPYILLLYILRCFLSDTELRWTRLSAGRRVLCNLHPSTFELRRVALTQPIFDAAVNYYCV